MTSILLIEDDSLLRETLATSLAEHGYRVRQAANGAEGLSLFCAEPADLVITDMVMPEKEGIETIGDLRRVAPRLGIIAMSGELAHNPQIYLKIAGALGANRTLLKPFTMAVLLQTIRDVLDETASRPKAAQAKTPPPSSRSPS
jgi:DNA-binding response OmpR family regulator